MFFFDVGILGADLVEEPVEEPIGHLEDVVFGEAGDFFSVVGACIFERIADDLFGSWASDHLQGVVDVVGLSVFDAGIEIFFVFPDDDDIHAGCLARSKGA